MAGKQLLVLGLQEEGLGDGEGLHLFVAIGQVFCQHSCKQLCRTAVFHALLGKEDGGAACGLQDLFNLSLGGAQTFKCKNRQLFALLFGKGFCFQRLVGQLAVGQDQSVGLSVG